MAGWRHLKKKHMPLHFGKTTLPRAGDEMIMTLVRFLLPLPPLMPHTQTQARHIQQLHEKGKGEDVMAGLGVGALSFLKA